MTPSPGGSSIVGVDGGGSKTHAVVLTIDGELLGRGDGPGRVRTSTGSPRSIDIVDAAVRSALAAASERAGPAPVAQANLYLSGLDLPPELAAYADAAATLPWTSRTTVVDNDLWALLRSGTEAPDAVAVVCGTGINGDRGACGARRASPRRRRASPRSGRSRATGAAGAGSARRRSGTPHVPRTAGVPRPPCTPPCSPGWTSRPSPSSPRTCTSAAGRSPTWRCSRPPSSRRPAAGMRWPAASSTARPPRWSPFARASLTRLGMLDREVPVVLGGGVIRAGDERLIAGITAGLADGGAARPDRAGRLAADRRRRAARPRVGRRHARRARPRPRGADRRVREGDRVMTKHRSTTLAAIALTLSIAGCSRWARSRPRRPGHRIRISDALESRGPRPTRRSRR